ncbi:MAG: hypothetical protein MJ252_18700 [archaeon]|nr:hypothetical protein [archaeon]
MDKAADSINMESDVNQELMLTESSNKKNNSVIKALVIVIAFLLFVGLMTGLLIIKRQKVPEEKPKEERIEETPSIFANFLGNEKFSYPFALKLVNNGKLKPIWTHSAFKTYPEEVKPMDLRDFSYQSMTSKTSYERSMFAGLGLDFSPGKVGAQIMGASINPLTLLVEMKNFQQKVSYKEAVWLKSQKGKIILEKDKIEILDVYKRELNTILDSTDSYDKKLSQLMEVLEEMGYYVPIEFAIGGQLSYTFEAHTKEEAQEIASLIEVDIEGIRIHDNTTYYKNISSYDTQLSLNYFGGEDVYIMINGTLGQIADWLQTININNSLPISYININPIWKFFPDDISAKFAEFKEELDQRFKIIFTKYQITDVAANTFINTTAKYGQNEGDYSFGLSNMYNQTYIHSDYEYVEYPATLMDITVKHYLKALTSHQSIVGVLIHQYQKNPWGGHFRFEESPMISNQLKIEMSSSINSAMKYGITWYYIDWTEYEKTR